MFKCKVIARLLVMHRYEGTRRLAVCHGYDRDNLWCDDACFFCGELRRHVENFEELWR